MLQLQARRRRSLDASLALLLWRVLPSLPLLHGIREGVAPAHELEGQHSPHALHHGLCSVVEIPRELRYQGVGQGAGVHPPEDVLYEVGLRAAHAEVDLPLQPGPQLRLEDLLVAEIRRVELHPEQVIARLRLHNVHHVDKLPVVRLVGGLDPRAWSGHVLRPGDLEVLVVLALLLLLELGLLLAAVAVVLLDLLLPQALLDSLDPLDLAGELLHAPSLPLLQPRHALLLALSQLLLPLHDGAAARPVLRRPKDLLNLCIDGGLAADGLPLELPVQLLIRADAQSSLLRSAPLLDERLRALLDQHLDLLPAEHPLGQAGGGLPRCLGVPELRKAKAQGLAVGVSAAPEGLDLPALLDDLLHVALVQLGGQLGHQQVDPGLLFGDQRAQPHDAGVVVALCRNQGCQLRRQARRAGMRKHRLRGVGQGRHRLSESGPHARAERLRLHHPAVRHHGAEGRRPR
mmetsp:Transcript_77944/g.206882  ORF Transcript_77944/g.206882 Transcript_77944/m.206882 type:complete len:460 (+) Transcript_77944:60-1439(+)